MLLIHHSCIKRVSSLNMDTTGFFLLLLALVAVDGAFPLRGPCVVSPKSFTLTGTYYANRRCRMGLVNWQYPEGVAYIHFKRGRKSAFDVCFTNLAGGHKLELIDLSKGHDKPKTLPRFPLRVRSLRKILRGKKGLLSKTRCIHSVKGKAELKVKAPVPSVYMAAFMYSVS